MTRPSQPLLFLVAVVGVWTAARMVALAPGWSTAKLPEARRLAARPAELVQRPVDDGLTEPFATAAATPPQLAERMSPFAGGATLAGLRAPRLFRPAALLPRLALPAAPLVSPVAPPAPRSRLTAPLPFSLAPAPAMPHLTSAAGRGRLSGSAWLLVRDDVGGRTLAPGGTLGGSQAGLRLSYRLNGDASRPLALSARAYLPLARPAGAEAAFGLDWRPVAEIPIHVLAERRQAIGREGRSDFSLTLYGGVDRPVANGRLRLQAYGQAGVVGTRKPDLFADGAARLTARAGPVDLGGGVWGGAQPGAERLDMGPHASARLPIGRGAVTVAAEWRFRIAGEAAPASGPALTLSTDF